MSKILPYPRKKINRQKKPRKENMPNMCEDIKLLKLELEKIQTQIQEKIGQEYKKILIKHPEILAFGWDQYTDYFNDGEQCNFSVQSLNVKFNPELIENKDESGWFEEDFYLIEDGFPEFRDVVKNVNITIIQKDLNQLNKIHSSEQFSTFFLGAFGDHVRIVIDKDSISITERTDHD